MKKLFLLTMIAFAVSCSNGVTDEPQTPDKPSTKHETVTVSFAMKGDVTVEETPLGRAAGVETESKDLYGISVYYDKDLDGTINDVYGYGLFDNIGDMTISLLTGYKYKFICSLVKDGKEKLGQYGTYYNGDYKSSYAGYCFPFCKSSMRYESDPYSYSSDIKPYTRYWDNEAGPTVLKNEFILGGNYHLTGLGQGYSMDKTIYQRPWINHYDKAYPLTDRFYGEITDYSPKEGGVVNIELKRCVFGAKFVVTGVTDGEFCFDVKANEATVCSKTDIKADITYNENIYTYRNVYGCWQKSTTQTDYSQDFTLNMTWKRGNGVTQTLDPLTITFKRNILTTVNIRLNGGDTGNSLNLKVEDAEMGEANTDLDIDAGDMTDTPVVPTE